MTNKASSSILVLNTTEEFYQGRWDKRMMADDGWSVTQDHLRQSKNARASSTNLCINELRMDVVSA